MKQKNNLLGFFVVLLFVFVVAVLYTFYNANGFSYLSDDSAACNNCHIMNDVYYDYGKASHSRMVDGKVKATCNDCHVPHDSAVSKWVAKAKSGVGHAYAFTFNLDKLPQHLSANENTKGWVQNNCIRCHSEMAASVVNATLDSHNGNALKCVSCHKGVGHKRDF